jgi:pyruvate formate lyase activating enzyme
MKGCPLKCAWCHNPEGQSTEIETMTRRDGTKIKCGEDWTSEDLVKELSVNADIMRQSGGGVTFSGGEPLMQADFLSETIELLKGEGLSVAIETSGYVPFADYKKIVSMVDFVYQDIKHYDKEAFRRWTNGDFSVVLENIEYLKTSGTPFVFRIPLIPGVNDSSADRVEFEKLTLGYEIEYLPYNNAAGAKYPLLGREFPLSWSLPIF